MMSIDPIVPPQPAAKPTAATPPRPVAVPAPPKVVNRVTQPNLTGFYEHMPVAGKHSAILLQLNQAGGMLVGWFTGPPAFVTNLSPTVSRARDWNETRMTPGVLIASLDNPDPWSQGFKFIWRQSPGSAQPDPADLIALHMLDPIDALPGGKTGYLRIIDGPFRGIGRELAIAFEFNNQFPIDNLARYDRLVRMSVATRLPNFIIQELPVEMQSKLLAEQVAPVPSSYHDEKRAAIAESGGERPSVAQLLTEYFATPNPTARRLKRDQIADYVAGALDPNQVTGYYRDRVYGPVLAQAAWKTLIINGVTRTYLDWYRQIAAEELDALRENQKASPRTAQKHEDNRLLSTFRKVGIEPVGDYLYTLSFGDWSDSVGKLMPQGRNPLLGSPSNIIKLKGGVFKLDIKKELVKVEKDSGGQIKYKEGKPVIQSRETVWDTSAGTTALIPTTYVGDGYVVVFGELGAGLELKGKEGKLAGGGSVKDVTILSSLDLAKEDFAFALLHSVLLGGPKAALGSFVSLEVFSSQYMQVRLATAKGGFVLAAEDTRLMSVKTADLNSIKPDFAWSLKEIAEKYDKKWTQPQAEARILAVSGSWGWIVPLFDTAKRNARPDGAVHRTKMTGVTHADRIWIEAFYKVGSADVDMRPVGTLASAVYSMLQLSPRQIIEIELATYLAFFRSPNVTLDAVGFTSPEQPAAANLILSKQRADAIIQAVKDAFGAELKIAQITSEGKGEEPALRSGLIDPESLPLTRAQFEAQYPEQVIKWPHWRRTELLIEGSFVVGIQAAE